jgi:hypothetical protein
VRVELSGAGFAGVQFIGSIEDAVVQQHGQRRVAPAW